MILKNVHLAAYVFLSVCKDIVNPGTSAATERSLNTLSWIYPKKRNRLRAGKLCLITHNN